MFADFVNGSSWENRPHRGWSTLASFALQTGFATALLLLPLLYTEALPRLHFTDSAILMQPPAPATATPRARSTSASSNLNGRHLMMPSQIPRMIVTLHDAEELQAPEIGEGFSIPGGTGPTGAQNPVLYALGNGIGYVPPPPKPAPRAPRFRISHMTEGDLVHRVQPVYPPLARQARIQGSVVLRAVIDREGKVTNLQLISGHPLLVQAAIEAVRQWRYRPYILNEQPVEVETQITVRFTLASGA